MEHPALNLLVRRLTSAKIGLNLSFAVFDHFSAGKRTANSRDSTKLLFILRKQFLNAGYEHRKGLLNHIKLNNQWFMGSYKSE